MTPSLLRLTLLSALALSPSLLRADPATAPATQAATAPVAATQTAAPKAPESPSRETITSSPTEYSRTLPISYQILTRKSIFSKDRTAGVEWSPRQERSRRFDTTPAAPPRIPVFIGAMHQDSGIVGYLEDPGSGTLKTLHVGDPLPTGGTIATLTLDYMEIKHPNAAALQRILLGQTLTGETPLEPVSASTASTDSTAATPATTPSSSDSAATPAASPSPAAVNDIIERLKRRRAQQTGG